MLNRPQDSPFPWPWAGSENRRLSVVVLLWIAALNLWALLAVDFFSISRPSPWDSTATQRAPLYARYDSGWYDSIARFGYGAPPPPGQPSAHAFFPLYPELARLLHLTTGVDSFPCALAVTYAALLLAIPLFVEEARFRFGADRAPATLPFLLLYPVGFFLAAVYTESLFLLLALLAFRDVRRGLLARTILWSLLAGLTRAPAAALGPALALAWWSRHEDSGRRAGRALLLLAAPGVGVALWIFGVGLAKGEPLLFFRVMGAWRHAAGDPRAGAAAFLAEPLKMWREGHFRAHPGALLPYVHLALFLFAAGFQLTRRRFADAAWSLGVLGLSVATGTSAGIPRYTSTIYPGHFSLFEFCETRPLLKRLLLGAYTAVLLLNAAFFVNWHFVS